MPQIVGSYATPRLDLGVAMWEYMLGPNQFVGTQVLPIFKTQKKAANFSRITKDSILRSRNVKRAPRGVYSRDTYDVKDQGYSCEERGHEQPLDDSERELYSSDFSAESAASRIAMQVVLQEQEREIASAVFNTTTWTGSTLYTDNSAGGNTWFTAANDVIAQVQAAKQHVRLNSGLKANALIISQTTLDTAIKINTAIAAKIQYTAIPTQDEIVRALGGLFGLPKVIVADAITNSADEGQTFTGADMWSAKYAMVARVCESEDLTEAGLGRTMLWAQDSAENATVEEYREEQTRSWIYRSRHNVDEIIFGAEFGHLIKIAA